MIVVPGSIAMYKIFFCFSEARIVWRGLFANIAYDGQLSATAYIILSVVLLVIIAGLGWCLYRAVTAAGGSAEVQSPDEVGDDGRAREGD